MPRVVRNFRSRRRTVSFFTFMNNEAMTGSLLLHKGGSEGHPPENFVKKMPSFGGHFAIQLSIFH